MPLAHLIHRFSTSAQYCFPVIDLDKKLVVMIDGEDIRPTVADGDLIGLILGLILAHDIAKPALTIFPQNTRLPAVTKMTGNEANTIVVVEPNDPDRPLAVLSYDRIVRAYSREIFESQ